MNVINFNDEVIIDANEIVCYYPLLKDGETVSTRVAVMEELYSNDFLVHIINYGDNYKRRKKDYQAILEFYGDTLASVFFHIPDKLIIDIDNIRSPVTKKDTSICIKTPYDNYRTIELKSLMKYDLAKYMKELTDLLNKKD